MVAGWEEAKTTEEKQMPCLQTIEVLKANLGKKCSVQCTDHSVLQGTIEEVLTQECGNHLAAGRPGRAGVSRGPHHAGALSRGRLGQLSWFPRRQ